MIQMIKMMRIQMMIMNLIEDINRIYMMKTKEFNVLDNKN